MPEQPPTYLHVVPPNDPPPAEELLAQLANLFNITTANAKVTIEITYRHGRFAVATRHESFTTTTLSDHT